MTLSGKGLLESWVTTWFRPIRALLRAGPSRCRSWFGSSESFSRPGSSTIVNLDLTGAGLSPTCYECNRKIILSTLVYKNVHTLQLCLYMSNTLSYPRHDWDLQFFFIFTYILKSFITKGIIQEHGKHVSLLWTISDHKENHEGQGHNPVWQC